MCTVIQTSDLLILSCSVSHLKQDLARHGKHHGVCPYYGARTLLRDADIVLAPYSSVLLPEARQALGLWLQGAVLVVDEAHNLVSLD